MTRARRAHAAAIAALFAARSVPYPPERVLVRAFKHEGELELWAGGAKGPLTLVKTWPVCAPSGVLGPKRRRGDRQVPEGFYRVDRFNPWSSYHLSLGLDYPNAADRRRGRPPLGGDIFIHGDCVTIGCIPIGDAAIEELYLVLADARAAGLRRIPVHVFPLRMDAAGLRRLKRLAGADPALWSFWENLAEGYRAFETTRRVPRIRVDPRTGRYRVRAVEAPAGRAGASAR